ncbi:hypothetical protein [Candidatus Arsenophonus triatominarum]|uniref:hypothetical protein n=1 Tax=Candidatus Arsenophonus triatominarum TaxID=57911 RepID=UPI0007C58024|nr:hypothetical protein [Candidatus Arsenophonus triatominarum]
MPAFNHVRRGGILIVRLTYKEKLISHLQELELKILKFLATKNPPVQNIEDKENSLSLADERSLIDTLYNLEKKGLVISGVNYGADGSHPLLSIDMVEITGYGLNVLSSD